MRTLLAIVIAMGLYGVYSVSTVRERHDFIKSVFGPLDDVVVSAGLIDDLTLHRIGSVLGLCDRLPSDTP